MCAPDDTAIAMRGGHKHQVSLSAPDLDIINMLSISAADNDHVFPRSDARPSSLQHGDAHGGKDEVDAPVLGFRWSFSD